MVIALKDLSIGRYNLEDLAGLWDIVKGKIRTSPMRYEPRGLIEVPFSIQIQEFEKDLFEKLQNHAPYVDELKIFLDLKEVLGFLEDKRVWLHHLCCAAECKSAHNSALAIHAMGNEQGKNGRKKYYLAVPGINYVPPLSIVEYWGESGRVDDFEYERWREMIERFESGT